MKMGKSTEKVKKAKSNTRSIEPMKKEV